MSLLVRIKLKSCIQNKKYRQPASDCPSWGESASANSSPQPGRNKPDFDGTSQGDGAHGVRAER